LKRRLQWPTRSSRPPRRRCRRQRGAEHRQQPARRQGEPAHRHEDDLANLLTATEMPRCFWGALKISVHSLGPPRCSTHQDRRWAGRRPHHPELHRHPTWPPSHGRAGAPQRPVREEVQARDGRWYTAHPAFTAPSTAAVRRGVVLLDVSRLQGRRGARSATRRPTPEHRGDRPRPAGRARRGAAPALGQPRLLQRASGSRPNTAWHNLYDLGDRQWTSPGFARPSRRRPPRAKS